MTSTAGCPSAGLTDVCSVRPAFACLLGFFLPFPVSTPTKFVLKSVEYTVKRCLLHAFREPTRFRRPLRRGLSDRRSRPFVGPILANLRSRQLLGDSRGMPQEQSADEVGCFLCDWSCDVAIVAGVMPVVE